MDFKHKAVVVTGAASGVGREIALAFARRGARLALADVDAAGLERARVELEERGGEVLARVVDVSSAPQVEDFRDRVYGEMGRVDVLCNNAGVAVGGRFEDIPLEDWRWIVGVNLWGVIHGCHFFYPCMIAQGGGGHIVNIASAAGLMPLPHGSPYCASKHAVVGFSETLRAEAALHGIGVTAVCPGFVLSGIYRSARQRTVVRGKTREEEVAEVEERLRKRGRAPALIADAVLDAVEKNRGLAVLLPEARLGDALYRLNRRTYGFLAALSTRMGSRHLEPLPGDACAQEGRGGMER